jgi:outer membrane protein assembly factor BamD (BamD/ComL family)
LYLKETARRSRMMVRRVHVMTLVLIVAVMVGGCSTPTADEMYAEAQAAHDAAQKVADSLGRKADFAALFTPVAAAYERVASEHPSSLPAEQALFKAAELHAGYLKNVPRAIEMYKRFVDSFPMSTKAPTALFMVGYLYNNHLGLSDSAAVAYRKFLRLYPQNELATSAQFEMETLGKKPEDLLPTQPGRDAAASPGATSPH